MTFDHVFTPLLPFVDKTMPHARQLSADERRIILKLHERGDTPDEIAEVVGRVRGTIHNVINNPNQLRALPRSGRPPKLSDQDRRNFFRKARTGNFFVREIVSTLNLPITIPYAQQLLSGDSHLLFRKAKGKPKMEPRHLAARVLWANVHVTWDIGEWNKVVWSDEKKFNLDGPDGCSYYWHDRRLPRKIFSKRHTGGGSITVWGCYSSAGVGVLTELEGRLNAASYVNILEESLLPFAYAEHGTEPEDFYFQHDGAPAHRAQVTRTWLQGIGVTVMDWPAVSPDLNPIENVWGILAQDVYKHGRQFENKDSLRQCLFQCWNNLRNDTLSKLNSSMRNRCIEVLRNNGHATKY